MQQLILNFVSLPEKRYAGTSRSAARQRVGTMKTSRKYMG